MSGASGTGCPPPGLPADDPAWSALAAWALPAPVLLAPLGQGLINRTLGVEDGRGGRFVLQRVNPIFSPAVHDDIEAVTAHLAARGLATPRLVPCASGARWVDLGEQGVWRLQTRLAGRSVERTADPALLYEAGRLVARFHRALADLAHEFRSVRLGVHDTARHLAGLQAALASHATHRLAGEILPVGRAILVAAAQLPSLPPTPRRVIHGDLKVSNVLFVPAPLPAGDAAASNDAGSAAVALGPGASALALVDLDTLGRGSLPVELGDALRSWCNPEGEESLTARFEPGLFAAALQGYAAGAATPEAAGREPGGPALPDAQERAAIVDGVRTIALELAARFARDALEECYFGWDPARFPGAAEHNLRRARSQLALARSVAAQQHEAQAAVARAFGAPRES